ncbi:hypothetical protein NM688_g9416 [Phlebia brevispora]|uniref:Uncharacterized protein n=1 Tax=Phlebia brevispora TaxID=194682 RepID=A0ACC1RFY6_9APHY|nr:hypothetical protein NM688_g9416 [Phlebia brevispora]
MSPRGTTRDCVFLILDIVVDNTRFYRRVGREGRQFNDANGLIKCASKILSTLNAPGAAHSVQHAGVLLFDLALYWNVRGQSPELMGLCQELDTVLAGLRESVHGIKAHIMQFEKEPFSPALKQTSDTLMAESFPRCKGSDSLLPMRIDK